LISQIFFPKAQALLMTVKNAADILAHLQQGQVDLGVTRVKTHDAQIAQAILDRLFSFEDLLFLSVLDMQTLLLKISDKTLVVCLKNVSKPLGIKILGAMTKARARSIGEDLQNSEKLRVSEIEAVQLEMLKVAYELHQTQNITLRKSAVDEKYI
jgi:flagellar motor switch protein FliG